MNFDIILEVCSKTLPRSTLLTNASAALQALGYIVDSPRQESTEKPKANREKEPEKAWSKNLPVSNQEPKGSDRTVSAQDMDATSSSKDQNDQVPENGVNAPSGYKSESDQEPAIPPPEPKEPSVVPVGQELSFCLMAILCPMSTPQIQASRRKTYPTYRLKMRIQSCLP